MAAGTAGPGRMSMSAAHEFGLPAPPPLGFPLKMTYGLGSVAYGVA